MDDRNNRIDGVDFSELEQRLGPRLIDVRSPLQARLGDPNDESSEQTISELQNFFHVQDQPGGFLTNGWYRAFDAKESPRAVAAESSKDVAAAVRFAKDKQIGIVVKGTGHDYLGRSSNPDSLLIWTHKMRDIIIHDDFTPVGVEQEGGVPAITFGAGTRWLEAYQALAPTGRYVQGGGCTSVGAAGGFTQGSGFGSFSRRYGTAAGNLLECEVVTASGEVLVANAYRNADLFWALRGGGGGTFGIVSKMTMRTHPFPETLGVAAGRVTASGPEEFRSLLFELVRLVGRLCDGHWGETVRITGENTLEFGMLAADVTEEGAQRAFGPFMDFVNASDAFELELTVFTLPFLNLWDPLMHEQMGSDLVRRDDRPLAKNDLFWWVANQGEVSQYLNAYKSRWLPSRLFDRSPDVLADALFDACHHWPVTLHLNKALWGANPEAVERDRATAINPAVFDAGALVITASNQQFVFPGVPGHQPDLELAASRSQAVENAIAAIRQVTPGAGSYLNETDYFEADWQESFWGSNYPRLLEIKRKYDPTNLLRVHHGVGSE
ncbi:MAG: FAD-binding oxidoreductase [Acidimicrobiales bacterium]